MKAKLFAQDQMQFKRFNERPAMKSSPHIKLLTFCIGVALANIAIQPALADSGVGVDTVIGNAMNPGYPSGHLEPHDPDAATNRRSPTGQLYNIPPVLSEELLPKTEGGWGYSASAEVGFLGGSNDRKKKTAKFTEYKDLRNGLYLNNFDVAMEKPDSARFFELHGGGVGREDQFYSLSVGRYNDWKVKTFYNETPHVFSTNFKSIYTNNGSNRPDLNNGTAGGTGATAAAVLSPYSKTLPDSDIGLVRRKGGIRLNMNLTDNWKTYASITQENRKGERPFGFQNANVEGIEPIDYITNDLLAGLQYSDKLNSFNLRVSASLFKNDIDKLYVRNPLVAANAAPLTLATQDFTAYTLAPDNQAYNVKGEFSRKLPDFFKGRLSASVAYGTSRQNDAIRMPLDPATSGAIANAAVNGVVFNPNNWNGVNGSPLSRATSGQRIDTELYNLALNLNPTDALNLKGTIRHYVTQNRSGTYYAYNPLTGQWGSGIEQTTAFNTNVAPAPGTVLGAPGNCMPAPGFTLPVGSTCAAALVDINALFGNSRSLFAPPRDNKQTNWTVAADYDLGNKASLEGALEREDFTHNYRERDKTWEDKIKLGYVHRNLGDTTLRASYENGRKRGSSYDALVTSRGGQDWFTIYGIPYSRGALQNLITNAGTGGIYPSLVNIQNWILGGNGTGGNFNSGGWMKPDQADRDQNIFNARLNYLATEDMDVGAMVQLKRARYPNGRGPQRDDLSSYNFDLNYQPAAANTRFTAYLSRQIGNQRQIENYGIDPNTGALFTAANLLTYVTNICGGLSVSNIDCWLNNQRAPSSDVTVETKNTNNILGLGVTHNFGWIMLSADYTFSKAFTTINRSNGRTALTAANQIVENANGQWPDITTVQNSLELNLMMPVNKKTAARLMYRYDDYRQQDWHYDYYGITPAATYIPADYGPQNYKITTVGVMLNFKM